MRNMETETTKRAFCTSKLDFNVGVDGAEPIHSLDKDAVFYIIKINVYPNVWINV